MAMQDRVSTCSTALLRAQMAKSPVSTPLKAETTHGPDELRKRGWAIPAVYVGNRRDVMLDQRWTSQVGQDRTIFHLFQGKEGGYFVDLAANDAVLISNTLTLEQEYGWNGLCVEANPSYFNLLYQRRCQVVQAAVGARDNEEVSFNFRNGMGGIVGDGFDNKQKEDSTSLLLTVSVGHMFLDLSVPAVIDYISLDIEGAEQWVFESFPWKDYTFLSMTVERPKDKLRQLLAENGYVYICNHGDDGDQLWLHSTFPNFQKAVSSLHLDDKEHPSCRGNWIHTMF